MVKVDIGHCECCSRRLLVVGKSLRRRMKVPCRCGRWTDIELDDGTFAVLRIEANSLDSRFPEREITLARIA